MRRATLRMTLESSTTRQVFITTPMRSSRTKGSSRGPSGKAGAKRLTSAEILSGGLYRLLPRRGLDHDLAGLQPRADRHPSRPRQRAGVVGLHRLRVDLDTVQLP